MEKNLMYTHKRIQRFLLMGVVVMVTGLLLSACDGSSEPDDATSGQANGVAETGDDVHSSNVNPVNIHRAATGGTRTMNLTIDEDGLSLNTLFIAQGTPTKLIFRNLSRDEHHYKVPDMPTSEVLWASENGEMDELEAFAAMFDSDADEHDHHAGHDDHEDHDDHAHHHASFTLSETPECNSRVGECPDGNAVHAHAQHEELDIVVFTPSEPGTYIVECPLHEDFQARIIVY
jgi:hypothetical protein